MALNEHDSAPDFELPDDQGTLVRLSSLKGRPVVLYFYPKADTPGCTVEACAFRDTLAEFTKRNAVVIGVSPDTPTAQAKFKAKFELTFPLLADADHKVAEAYGVRKEKTLYGKKHMGIERTTFIIGADGAIARIFAKVKVEGHAGEVLAAM
jgi:thioredoxin-dependent peroxiredoxin